MHKLFPSVVPAVALAILAAGASARAQDRAIHCGTLLTGDGSTALHDVWLQLKDGKILAIGKDAPPAGVPVVDARDKVVMPGIVAVDSDLSGAADSEYQVTPDALATDAFDFAQKLRSELEGGVTTVYLSPGRQRLIAGQGAVVKTAGVDIVERILDENSCLRVDFGDSAIRAPRVFEPTPHPTSDDPLQASRIQTPTSRISVLPELRALFAEAAAAKGPQGEGPAEDHYDPAAIAAVVNKKLAMRAAAFRTQDVQRALEFQKELGCRMVLEDPQEIGPLAATAAAQQVTATFRMPLRFGQQNPGGEDRLQKAPEPQPDAPAKAAAAGMKIGIAPAPGVPTRDYLLAVALAVKSGLPPANALRAIGQDAAAILGVDQRVGTLAPGKDADFVVLSGEPLAVGTMVESTWIGGSEVYTRKEKAAHAVLAVRCGRILDAEGHVYRNGVILTQNGRIKAVGEDLAIPYGADVIDLPDAVMTPGLLDAFSNLGLAGDGATVPQGSPEQRLDEAVAFDDPMFAKAREAGLTTLLVGGKDGGPPSRIAALKTGAADQASMVVHAIAGLRLQHDAIGPDAIKALRDQLERGKAYQKQFADYEKALAEWQSGKAAAPAPEAKPEEPKAEAPTVDPITGTWEATIDIQGQIQIKVTLALKRSGSKVTGTVAMSFAGRDMPPRDIESGTWENNRLVIEFPGMGRNGPPAKLEATVNGDTMTGKLSLGRAGDQDVTATRTSKEAPTAQAPRRQVADKPAEDGKPKEPKIDPAQEPMRAVLDKRAALVVTCKRATAIADVIALLEKEQVPYVLDAVDDLLDDPTVAGDKLPPILVGPQVVEENDGELRCVPALLADRGNPIAFASGECAGSSLLPLHATYAVRYGLSPADALAAMTIWPAKAFRVDDRVGSLTKGKDADFVVFSGNPFEPTSRVLLVVCNGKVVVDHREAK